MEDIDFWVDFVLKIEKNSKIGFGRKNQLSPQCVHIAEFWNFQFWKCEKCKNCAHTLAKSTSYASNNHM